MPRARDTLSLLIEVESRSADIYLVLSRKFHQVQEVSDFWKKLMKDERAHTNILKDIEHSIQQEKLQLDVDEKVVKNISKTHKWIMKDLTETVHNLDDAYELSHAIESKEVEMLFELLATDLGKYVEKLRMIMFEEQGHLQSILEFSVDYGKAQWRRSIHAD